MRGTSEVIRVLHVVGVMNRGGVETLIMNLYRKIDREKIQFDFLTHHDVEGAYDNEIKSLGGRIYTVPYGIKTLHFRYIKALRRFFKEHTEYKIIHSHMSDAAGIIAKVGKEFNIPVRIAHSHISNPNHSVFQKIYLQGYSRRLINSNCTHCFACSDEAGKYLFKNRIVNRDYSIIKNAIDLEKFYPNKDKKEDKLFLTNDLDKVLIGHVGRFEKQKNHEFLIDIFFEFNKIVPNSELFLIGGGALGDEGTKTMIEKKVFNLGLTNKVKFLGVRNDVDKIMKALDLFVFPSLYEGLPLTLVEAESTGVSCIVSDTITKEIDLGLKNFKFANINDIEDWIKKMLQLLSINDIDRKECNTTVKNAGYDINDLVDKLQSFYLKCLKVDNLIMEKVI